ncbi:unnamed protein product [Cladocopium goreaui]|uniref:CMP/dCMP-type deaminase domain-containing protein n=1 Tax=Cladocopium goreaui TaxID=2562237 RepID=A0A9P1BU71_9DINO|nr:unnamed protein product [Cladocopium goreaui]
MERCPTPLPTPVLDAKQLARLLSVIEEEVLPKTAQGVKEGNKVFGAAVLRDVEGYPTVIAETNHEMLCPLYHGEVYTIKQLSELPADQRPNPEECLFLSTHEPCCMCVSAIVWAGYKKIVYLFPYESTRDQGIPHDLQIMHELWAVERYQVRNKFCSSAGIPELIQHLPEDHRPALTQQVSRITSKYGELSQKYHQVTPLRKCPAWQLENL